MDHNAAGEETWGPRATRTRDDAAAAPALRAPCLGHTTTGMLCVATSSYASHPCQPTLSRQCALHCAILRAACRSTAEAAPTSTNSSSTAAATVHALLAAITADSQVMSSPRHSAGMYTAAPSGVVSRPGRREGAKAVRLYSLPRSSND